jgi:hypothetical protein
MWYDIAGALNANTFNLQTQSTMQGHVSDAQSYLATESADMVQAALTLNIPIASITPIPPS